MTDIKKLPRLEIVRDTYITQEMMDAACEYIEKNHPDLVKEFLLGEEGRAGDYPGLLGHMFTYLANVPDDVFRAPKTAFETLDFAYEMGRRARHVQNLPEVHVKGHPLAPSIDGPYPPLVRLPVSDKTKECGLTQKIVDEILAEAYARHPNSWFIRGEELRRHTTSRCQKPIDIVVHDVFMERALEALSIRSEKITALKEKEVRGWRNQINHEAHRRLAKMCGIQLP